MPAAASPQPRILGLATAVPPHVVDQKTAAREAALRFPAFAANEYLASIFLNAGIERRHIAAPLDWYLSPRDIGERHAMFIEAGAALYEAVAARTLARADLSVRDIDVAVTVTSSGLATPSLEARAADRLALRADVRRIPVVGLGCAGGVTGLAIAGALAQALPGRNVLLVAIETCSLAVRWDRPGKADLVAAALFGDGAAGAVLRCDEAPGLRIGRSAEHRLPASLDIMGWSVDPVGLGVIFDRSIPELITAELPAILAASGLTKDIARPICHPGGAKVIGALEGAFALERGALDHERAVLAAYGNMSGPTVLFVLERALASGLAGRLALSALGPGFTASLLEVTAP